MLTLHPLTPIEPLADRRYADIRGNLVSQVSVGYGQLDTPTIPVLSFPQPIQGVGRKENLGLPQPSEISHGAQVDDTDRRVSEL